MCISLNQFLAPVFPSGQPLSAFQEGTEELTSGPLAYAAGALNLVPAHLPHIILFHIIKESRPENIKGKIKTENKFCIFY